MKLAGKNVVITGGAGGIGVAIAAEMLAAGAAVMLADRDVTGVKRAALSLGAGDRATSIAADLTNDSDLDQLAGATAAWRGGVDVLINTAGVNHFALFESQSPAAIERTLTINVLALMLVTRTLLPQLKSRPEAGILNIGSVFGSIGYPGYAAYAASKFAVRGFTEALRRELADTVVRCHCVAPRATRTSINTGTVDAMNEALGNAVDTPQAVAAVVRRTLEKNHGFVVVGWPEKLFARLNGLFPGIVERAIVKQLPVIQQFARAGSKSANNAAPPTTTDAPLRSQGT